MVFSFLAASTLFNTSEISIKEKNNELETDKLDTIEILAAIHYYSSETDINNALNYIGSDTGVILIGKK